MKYIVLSIVSLMLGLFVARALWIKTQTPVDPIQVMITQMRTHALVEHERQIAVWYRACPEVPGVNPQLFIAWPGRLTYQLELDDVRIERAGGAITVHAQGITPREPGIPTDFLDYLSSGSLLTFANEKELINEEIRKASPVARYLTAYFLLRDASLRGEFTHEIDELIRRMAGALGVPVNSVNVVLDQKQTRLPKLPHIELCAGSSASVNGYPFAKLEDQFIVPIAFRPGSQEPAAMPHGIASVYAPDGATRPAR